MAALNTADHYALLLAINTYPGLSNLAGPENDALALRDWLLDPAGGAVDPAHLALIKSSDFPSTQDPYDANPGDTQLKKVLNQWLKQDGKWRDRVGQRLYLFFAGHGFTAGTLTDPALFTAQAQLDDRTHIAGLRYAQKIANAGFFDEVVLLMDCCQDVLKASAVMEPSWSPPDRMASDKVKMLVAFGAPRGRKAFEQSPQAPAPGVAAPLVHGYFSSVFLDALRSAPVDDDGYVTARAVEATFSDLWAKRYLDQTDYEPPFTAPRDMRLYQRAAVTIPPAATAGTAASAGAVAPETTRGLTRAKPASLNVPIRINTADLGAHIRVFDQRNRVVAQATGGLQRKLPQGDYTARIVYGAGSSAVRSPVTQHPFHLNIGDSPIKLQLPGAHLASPIPAGWSRSHHEFHQGAAAQWLAAQAESAQLPGANATLLVFARDSGHVWGQPWRMRNPLRKGLRLMRVLPTTGELRAVKLQVHTDAARAFSAFKIDLPGGTYLLGVKRRLRKRWVWDEMPLHVSAQGWRTEVWLDCQDDEQDGRRFDLDSASPLVVPRQAPSWIDTEHARSTELLRALLLQPTLNAKDVTTAVKASFQPDSAGPMATLYAATLLARVQSPQVTRVQKLLTWLTQHWSAASADVALLQRWCESAARATGARRPPALSLPNDAVPMLALNWALLTDARCDAQLAKPMQAAVALWRTSSEAWVQTQRPELVASASNVKPCKSALLPRLADGAIDLLRMAQSLGRPDPTLSPFHQSLRSVLLDACEDGSLEQLKRVLAEVVKSSALDDGVLEQALQDLWRTRK